MAKKIAPSKWKAQFLTFVPFIPSEGRPSDEGLHHEGTE